MGNKIKEARKEVKMSQEELSEKSGVSRATISGLENMRSSITKTSTLQKLADALGKTIQEIFFAD